MSTVLVQEEDFYFHIEIKAEHGKDWPILARFLVLVSMKQRTKATSNPLYSQALIYTSLEVIERMLQLEKKRYVWGASGMINWHTNEPTEPSLRMIDIREVKFLDATVN